MTRRSLQASLPALLACAVAGFLIGCTPVQQDAAVPSLEAEVRTFMTGYAADLSSCNREAVAARYTQRVLTYFAGARTPSLVRRNSRKVPHCMEAAGEVRMVRAEQ